MERAQQIAQRIEEMARECQQLKADLAAIAAGADARYFDESLPLPERKAASELLYLTNRLDGEIRVVGQS